MLQWVNHLQLRGHLEVLDLIQSPLGFIATDMTDKLSDDVKSSFISKIPLGRFGEPKEVAMQWHFYLVTTHHLLHASDSKSKRWNVYVVYG